MSAMPASMFSTALTLDYAIDYLMSAMKDPLNPESCHLRVRAAAERLGDEFLQHRDTFPELHKLTKAHPKLLRAGIRFLTRNQTPKDHAAMVEHLCNCRCDVNRPGMMVQHYLGGKIQGSYPAEPTSRLMKAVFLIGRHVGSALKSSTKSKFKTQTKNPSIDSDAPWPASPDDLLPFGILDSVEGLKLWATMPEGDGIYLLVGAMVEFYQPFANATFQPPEYDFALRCPLRHLTAVMDALNSGKNDSRALTNFENATTVLTSYFTAHLMNNYSGHFINMLISQKQVAYPVLDRLWAIVRSRPQTDSVRSAAALMRDFSKLKIDPQTGEPYLPPGETMEAADTIAGPTDEVQDALCHMYHVRAGGCLNPTCTSNTAGVYTRLCSNCKVVRFCGVECQKAAWKHREYPHKILCAKIRALQDKLGIKDWGPTLERAETETDGSKPFLELCKAKGVDFASVQEIADILQGLRGPALANMGFAT